MLIGRASFIDIYNLTNTFIEHKNSPVEQLQNLFHSWKRRLL